MPGGGCVKSSILLTLDVIEKVIAEDAAVLHQRFVAPSADRYARHEGQYFVKLLTLHRLPLFGLVSPLPPMVVETRLAQLQIVGQPETPFRLSRRHQHTSVEGAGSEWEDPVPRVDVHLSLIHI